MNTQLFCSQKELMIYEALHISSRCQVASGSYVANISHSHKVCFTVACELLQHIAEEDDWRLLSD